jgi:CHAT domain-containing protein
MASKKGIIITIIILVTITAASFIIWQMPTNPQMSVVVSDFNSHIIGIDERYKMISNANDESFEQMIDGEISPDEYISIAEISSSQINSQIIELVESNATDEWIDSYLNNLESLRSYNSSIRETIVLANLINGNAGIDEKSDILIKIEQLKQESKEYSKLSISSRP